MLLLDAGTEFAALAARATDLQRTQQCPSCGNRLSLWEAIAMIWGGGFRRHVKVRMENGKEYVLPAESVNPQTMQIIGE
jgi:hypothetical protein